MQLGRYSRFNSNKGRITYPFYTLTESQRLRHIWAIGKTGVGKSTAFINWAIKDIKAGHGLFFLDPHGQDAETLLTLIPSSRRRDVIFFAPHEYPIGFNVLADVNKDRRSFIATSGVDMVKSIFELD